MAKPGDIYERFSAAWPEPAEGDLRIWWIPQIPGRQFWWPVDDLRQAGMMLNALAAYDDFQFAQRVKGDYSNCGGLCIYRDGAWEDWESEEGDDFDAFRHEAKP
jgi:hypothetical protein